jgi:hypothetical protein
MVRQLAQSNPEALGPRGKMLAEAQAKGDQNMTAIHASLMQTDPDYRQMLSDLEREL